MPYTNAQKKQHIKEIQTYLYYISMMTGTIPPVFPSGIYGKESEASVRAFQHEYKLPETGNVDPATWDKIVGVYKGFLKKEPLAYSCFPSGGHTVKGGDSGHIVYIIQTMLDSIRTCFDCIPPLSVSGTYNNDTVAAVKHFQSKAGLFPSGTVDVKTWNLLVKTCEHSHKMIK